MLVPNKDPVNLKQVVAKEHDLNNLHKKNFRSSIRLNFTALKNGIKLMNFPGVGVPINPIVPIIWKKIKTFLEEIPCGGGGGGHRINNAL